MDEPAGSAVIVAVDQGTSSTKALAVDAAGNVVGLGVRRGRPAASAARMGRTGCRGDRRQRGRGRAARRRRHRGPGRRASRSAPSGNRPSSGIAPPASRSGRCSAGRTGARSRPRRRLLRRDAGHAERVRHITGLPVDPMFSALKFAWLLDRVDPGRERSNRGELALGTVDAWLVHRLTGAVPHRDRQRQPHRTARPGDPRLERRAARTLPHPARRRCPPVVRVERADRTGDRPADAAGRDAHPRRSRRLARRPLRARRPHARFGQGHPRHRIVDHGTARVARHPAPDGLVTTVAWSDPAPSYAFEGNILSTGATLVWLAEVLETTPAELAALAAETDRDADPGRGVDLVPAFSGLGAPWWDDDARAIITGFDLSTTRAELARAAVESIPLQIDDVLCAAEKLDRPPLRHHPHRRRPGRQRLARPTARRPEPAPGAATGRRRAVRPRCRPPRRHRRRHLDRRGRAGARPQRHDLRARS